MRTLQLGLPQHPAALSSSFGRGGASLPSPLTLMLQGHSPNPRPQRSNSSSSGGLNISSPSRNEQSGGQQSSDYTGGLESILSQRSFEPSGDPRTSSSARGLVADSPSGSNNQSGYEQSSSKHGRGMDHGSGGPQGHKNGSARSTADALAQAAQLCAAVEGGHRNSNALGVTWLQGSDAVKIATKLRSTLASIHGSQTNTVHSPFENSEA